MPVEYQLCGCCIPDSCPHCFDWGIGRALFWTYTCEACPTENLGGGFILENTSHVATDEQWFHTQFFFGFGIGCSDSPTFGPVYTIVGDPSWVWHLQQSFYMQCDPFLVQWHPRWALCNGPFGPFEPPDDPLCVATAVDVHPNGACVIAAWTGSGLTLVVGDGPNAGTYPVTYDAVNDWWEVVIPGASGGTWIMYFEKGFMWNIKTAGTGSPSAPRVCFSVSCSPTEVIWFGGAFNTIFGGPVLS